MLYRISVTERGLTGIANIFRSRLSRLDDLLGAGTVPLRVQAERRSREAGIGQLMKILSWLCGYVDGWVGNNGMYGIWNYLAKQGT